MIMMMVMVMVMVMIVRLGARTMGVVVRTAMVMFMPVSLVMGVFMIIVCLAHSAAPVIPVVEHRTYSDCRFKPSRPAQFRG